MNIGRALRLSGRLVAAATVVGFVLVSPHAASATEAPDSPCRHGLAADTSSHHDLAPDTSSHHELATDNMSNHDQVPPNGSN
jgi:hypothetical protein